MATAERRSVLQGAQLKGSPGEKLSTSALGAARIDRTQPTYTRTRIGVFGRVAAAYAIAISIWAVLALLLAFEYRLNMRSVNPSETFWSYVRLPAFRFFCFALLTPPVIAIVRRFPITSGHLFRRAGLYAIGAAAFVLSYSLLRFLLFPVWGVDARTWVRRSWPVFLGVVQGTFVDQITTYITIVFLAHAYAFFDRARARELEKSELQEALTASELQSLKMQLHPHFLFNTLHGISTLMENEPAAAKRMLVNLADLLRIALSHGSSDLIGFQEEIGFIRAYLDLEQMRLGSRLSVRWNLPSDLHAVLVPQMILQPLVENAIVHGVACSRTGGFIEISAAIRDGKLQVDVRNSVASNKGRGTGLGLRNTRARLKCLYGDEAKLLFSIQEGQYAEAAVVLPALGHVSRQTKSFEETT